MSAVRRHAPRRHHGARPGGVARSGTSDVFGRRARVHRARLRAGARRAPSGVPDADLRFAFLRFGSCVVELLCYDNDREETFDRSNADVGSAHVCIDVPDLQAAYDDLLGQGRRVPGATAAHRRRAAGGLLLRLLQGPRTA